MDPTLDELAALHGTDKRDGRHNYTSIYEQCLAPWRHRPVSVLEIGVKDGASLRMWRDYFPNGEIHGIDVVPDTVRHAGDRIHVHIGDQRDRVFLEATAEQTGPLDIVLDDGSHRYQDQSASLRTLWKHVKPGGIYIVEDLHTSYLEDFGMGYRRRESTVEMLKELIDDIHHMVHRHHPLLFGVAAAHFHFKTCVIVKAPGPR